SVFEQQIAWLKRNMRLLCEHELIEIMDSRRYPSEPCALITFDDGYLDNYTLAYPILKRLGAPAIFFIPSYLIESRTVGWWDQIREMSRDMAIGSHGHTHTVLATLDVRAQKQELEISKSILERRISKPVTSIAYPVGGREHFTMETEKAAEQRGYRAAFSFAT